MSSSYIVQVGPEDPSCISRRVGELFCDYVKSNTDLSYG